MEHLKSRRVREHRACRLTGLSRAVVDFSISGLRVARALEELSRHHPLPRNIVCDNGPEFTSKALFF